MIRVGIHNPLRTARRLVHWASSSCIIGAMLPFMAAAQVPCLSGFVRDANGNPVVGGDLDFNISQTGERIITPGDNTDGSGFYNVCVLPNIYDVSFAPPPRSNLRGLLVPRVDLRSAPGRELDVRLEFGTPVSGVITDPDGQPVGDVDVDVDAAIGGRLFTPDDNSDLLSGEYWVVVPNGTYQFRFEPRLGSRLRGVQLDAVEVTAPLSLDVQLESGWLIAGRITDSATGNPVADVDIGLRDATTGDKIFLANNSSNIDGDYSVAAPLGEFELRIEPPTNARYIARAIRPFDVMADVDLDLELETGNVLTVTIVDEFDQPIGGADLDVKVVATGEKLFTPYDRSTLDGLSFAVVPPDSYVVSIDPPIGTSFDRVEFAPMWVDRDIDLRVTLPQLARVEVSIRVLDTSASPVPSAKFHAYLLPLGTSVFLQEDLTDATGVLSLALPPGDYDLTVSPPEDVALVGQRLSGVVVVEGAMLDDVILKTGSFVDLQIVDEQGAPIAGADVDFRIVGSGEEIFTPRDNSDTNGRLRLVVEDGAYDVFVEAPLGAGFRNRLVESFMVAGDVSETIVLARDAIDGAGPVKLLPNQPNPFGEFTEILYSVNSGVQGSAKIYDSAGRLVRSIPVTRSSAGTGVIRWDAQDSEGRSVANGLYFVRLSTQSGSDVRKIIHIQ